MTVALGAACALLGLLVGSFLNVVIHRVPRGASVVRPPSACPGCGAPVRPRDNVPVLSWLLLRGRCRHCRMRIPWRYPAVELLTAVLFTVVGLRIGAVWALPAFLYATAAGVALAAIDLDCKRLPNAIVLPSYGVGLVLLGVAAVAGADGVAYLRALAGMALLFVLFLALAVASPRGMGFGDVKLAGVLGLHLAWVGWSALAVGAFAGFLLGGLVGVAGMAAGRATRKTAIPFGPFMLAGALVGLLAGDALVEAYLGVALG